MDDLDIIVVIAISIFVLSKLKNLTNKHPDIMASILPFFIGLGIGNLITDYIGIPIIKWLIAGLFVYKGRPMMLRYYKRKRIIKKESGGAR
jgi:hypothetical protein